MTFQELWYAVAQNFELLDEPDYTDWVSEVSSRRARVIYRALNRFEQLDIVEVTKYESRGRRFTSHVRLNYIGRQFYHWLVKEMHLRYRAQEKSKKLVAIQRSGSV